MIAMEDWQAATSELEQELAWTTRRANLLVKGISLEAKQDAIIQIGEAAIQIRGECDQCGRVDESCAGL